MAALWELMLVEKEYVEAILAKGAESEDWEQVMTQTKDPVQAIECWRFAKAKELLDLDRGNSLHIDFEKYFAQGMENGSVRAPPH